jgi:glycosyltransferase involved in cell wall biosynthesis
MFAGFENVVWESHTGAWNWAARYLAVRTKIVVISKGLKDFYVGQGVSAERITIAHDGVDLSAFDSPISKHEARERLGLPHDKKIALYIGGVGGWKGTDTLFEASRLLPDTVSVAVIGKASTTLKAQYPNIIFLGERLYTEIADNSQAANVLILPTSSRSIVGVKFTSPLKLFTYMASRIPIVASDVSSTREVLPEDGAYWFTADDAESLAKTITEALNDPVAHNRTQVARASVARYTWDTRAQAILAFV